MAQRQASAHQADIKVNDALIATACHVMAAEQLPVKHPFVVCQSAYCKSQKCLWLNGRMTVG